MPLLDDARTQLSIEKLNHSACPSCGGDTLSPFYEVRGVPVHSALRMPTRAAALHGPTGDVVLAFCSACGFITNQAFDAEKMTYSEEYEGTQAFSPTFNAFHRRLAQDLIDRYDLRGKRILEIGCGRGEFLALLCEMGNNEGVGFDPAYPDDPAASPPGVTIFKEIYAPGRTSGTFDLVCCKMTLEHIDDVGAFISTVRQGLVEESETVVFFQVPDAERILREGAFWDIYYEHCSYFTSTSLAHLFRCQGFAVRRTWTEYDGQYLMIEAQPSALPAAPPSNASLRTLRHDVDHFARHVPRQQEAWRRLVRDAHQAGRRIVLWGGGSKAVAFLTTLALSDEIACVVDVNPHKHGTFIAGTGQEIVSPEALAETPPDLVIVMNPVYCEEIRAMLDQMHLAPTLIASDQSIKQARNHVG